MNISKYIESGTYFKKELFEEVCTVADDVQKYGGEVDSQQSCQQSSSKRHLHPHSKLPIV